MKLFHLIIEINNLHVTLHKRTLFVSLLLFTDETDSKLRKLLPSVPQKELRSDASKDELDFITIVSSVSVWLHIPFLKRCQVNTESLFFLC